MHRGRDVHRDLVRRIRKVRRELAREEEGMEDLQRRMAESGERRAATVRALAEFHLPGMNEESVAGTLAGMEAGIRAIYEDKKDRLDVVERAIPAQRGAVGEVEAALATVTGALNETGRERARLGRIVFEELQEMPRWQRLFEQVRKREARVAASEKRREAALREQKEKTPAYERDPMFAYLSRRGYGTRAAAGNPLTRPLDRWVAELSGYESERAKYDLLNALPGHAESALEEDRKALAVATPPLERLEAEVIARHGMTPVLERGERLYAERGEARNALRDAEAALRSLTDELAALRDERGSYYEQAIDGIESHLEGHSLDELVAMARGTADHRDDTLVAELGELDSQLADLRARLAERREERTRLASRLRELEDLRDRFEAEDWDGRRSEFDGSLDMNALLMGFLAGRHSSRRLYRTLRRHQHFRPISDSGFGSRRGFGGGGFRTGGGFGRGGGGFRTGGGF